MRKTTIEWLHRKKLVTDHELLTAEMLGLLLEYRLTLVGPIDSFTLTIEKYMRSAPLLLGPPVEFHPKPMLLGTKNGGEDATPHEPDLERLTQCWLNEETSKDRAWLKLAVNG